MRTVFSLIIFPSHRELSFLISLSALNVKFLSVCYFFFLMSTSFNSSFYVNFHFSSSFLFLMRTVFSLIIVPSYRELRSCYHLVPLMCHFFFSPFFLPSVNFFPLIFLSERSFTFLIFLS